MTYDMTLQFAGGKGLDYRKDEHRFPGLAAPEWALAFYRHPDWRKIESFFFLPHDGATARAADGEWGRAWFTFDEDDDCHRRECVELYFPGDPYVLERNPPHAGTKSTIRITRTQWDASLRLHRHALRLGFTDASVTEFMLATGIHEKYENAYWLREEVLRRLLAEAPPEMDAPILRASYSRNDKILVKLMENVAANR